MQTEYCTKMLCYVYSTKQTVWSVQTNYRTNDTYESVIFSE